MRDGLRRLVPPGAFVDTTPVHEQKTAALACHESQRKWLDATQDMDDYVGTMDAFSRETGRLSGAFRFRPSHCSDFFSGAIGHHFSVVEWLSCSAASSPSFLSDA